MGKKVFHELIPFEDALSLLLDEFSKRVKYPLAGEEVPVEECIGRITAEPVFAKMSSPYFHSAAMDGYAVRAEDTFDASELKPKRLKLGKQAVWIETGDPLPSGFNAVIPLEEATKFEDEIEIYRSYSPYHHVRHVGEDIVATEMIIPENYLIGPVEASAILASGITKVKVRKKPIIGIIPTGSELVSSKELENTKLSPPQLIEYNSLMLRGFIKEDFSEPKVYPITPDNENVLSEVLKQALTECDVVLINAGSGYGEEDFTYKVIKDLGEVVINGVAIKPGKPFIAGFCESVPVLGIPGYPVSAFFTYKFFVRPIIEKLIGTKLKKPDVIRGIISRKISSRLGVDEFLRVKVGCVKDKTIVSPVGRGAGLLMSVVRADGYIRLPKDCEGFSQGQEVDVFLWKDKSEIKNTIVCIGSHDNTLDILYNFLRKRYPEVSLSSSHVGSMGGILAIKRGEAHVAGTHLLDESSGEYNIPFIKKLLPEKKVVLVNLVYRVQGFIVPKGNPKGIKKFCDLAREDVVFINRQGGSGTRLLLDKYLREEGILPEEIKGYENEEYTHMGVAQAVASGRADVGLGIYAAAKALGLDFIPVAEERYDLLIPKEFLELSIIQALLDVIKNDEEFRKLVESLGGYDTRDMGKIIYEN